MKKKKLILASKSPRRNEILKNLNIDFTVITTDADESSINPEGLDVGVYVQELAMLKAADCIKKTESDDELIIIAADTVVSIDGLILGKPKNEEDAFLMLKNLSGRTHEVYTGFCVMRSTDAKCLCEACVTKVLFKELSDEEIRDYIKTDEYKDKTGIPIWNTKKPWEDKAGGYGIQEPFGMKYIKRIEGDYYNVVGLPISRICQVLKNEFDFKI